MTAPRAMALVSHWIRSTTCSGGACVELAELQDGCIAVRDSKNPAQQPLVITRDELRAWVEGAKAGEFDGFC